MSKIPGLVFALTVAALPTLAAAQSASVSVGSQALNVYDAHNKLVGPLYGVDPDGNTIVVMTLGGFKNFVALGQEGYSVNATFYFGQPNCKGQAFVQFDRYQTLIPEAVFDGNTLYYLNPNQDGNYAVESKFENNACSNLPDNSTMGATGAYGVDAPFTPPFSIR